MSIEQLEELVKTWEMSRSAIRVSLTTDGIVVGMVAFVADVDATAFKLSVSGSVGQPEAFFAIPFASIRGFGKTKPRESGSVAFTELILQNGKIHLEVLGA